VNIKYDGYAVAMYDHRSSRHLYIWHHDGCQCYHTRALLRNTRVAEYTSDGFHEWLPEPFLISGTLSNCEIMIKKSIAGKCKVHAQHTMNGRRRVGSSERAEADCPAVGSRHGRRQAGCMHEWRCPSGASRSASLSAAKGERPPEAKEKAPGCWSRRQGAEEGSAAGLGIHIPSGRSLALPARSSQRHGASLQAISFLFRKFHGACVASRQWTRRISGLLDRDADACWVESEWGRAGQASLSWV
jgi:hypothetical protein